MKQYKINYNLVGGKYLDVLLYNYLSSLSIDTEFLFAPLISMDFINSYPDEFNFNLDINELKKRYASVLEKYNDYIDHLSKKKYLAAFENKIIALRETNQYNIISFLKQNSFRNLSNMLSNSDFFLTSKYIQYKQIYRELKSKQYTSWLNQILDLNKSTYRTLYFETKNDNIIKEQLNLDELQYLNLMKIDSFVNSSNKDLDKIVAYRDNLRQDIINHTIIIEKTADNFRLVENNLLEKDTRGRPLYYYLDQQKYQDLINRTNLNKINEAELDIYDIKLNKLKNGIKNGCINFKFIPNLNIFQKNPNFKKLSYDEILPIIKRNLLRDNFLEEQNNEFNFKTSNNLLQIKINEDELILKNSGGRDIILNDIEYDKIYCVPSNFVRKMGNNSILINNVKNIVEILVNYYVYKDELLYFDNINNINGNYLSYRQLKIDRQIVTGDEYESKHILSVYSKIISILNNNLFALKRRYPMLNRHRGHNLDNNYRILNGYEYGEAENGSPIGELDLVILDDNNFIVAVGEIKNYLDGANEGYLQLKKFSQYIKNKIRRGQKLNLFKSLVDNKIHKISAGIYEDFYKKMILNTPVEYNKYLFLILANRNYAGISNSKETYGFVGKLIKQEKIIYDSVDEKLKIKDTSLDNTDQDFNIINDSNDYTFEILEKYNNPQSSNLIIIN